MADGYEYLDRESALKHIQDIRTSCAKVDQLSPEMASLLEQMEFAARNAEAFISMLNVVDMGMVNEVQSLFERFITLGQFPVSRGDEGKVLLN